MASNVGVFGDVVQAADKWDMTQAAWKCACLLSILTMMKQLYCSRPGTRISLTQETLGLRITCETSRLRTVSMRIYTAHKTRNSELLFDQNFKEWQLESLASTLVESLKKELPVWLASYLKSETSIMDKEESLEQSMEDLFDVPRLTRHLITNYNPLGR